VSLTALKKSVTSYFKARQVLAKTIANEVVDSGDDLFELYVLSSLLETLPPAQVALRNLDGKSTFVVACSPSASWSRASHIEVLTALRPLCVRTGLKVRLSDGTFAEVDVVVVDGSPGQIVGDNVGAAALVAGFECKALGGNLAMSVSDMVIGKATRIWGYPAPPVTIGNTLSIYCLVSLRGVSPNPKTALGSAGVDVIENLVSSVLDLEHRHTLLRAALGI
jgi:hypothetical protein